MTSLSETLTTLLASNPDLKTGLEAFAHNLKEATGTKADFCRLHGNRWAYAAGLPDSVIPEERIIIAPGWGVIVENNRLTKEAWNDIGARLPPA